MTVSDIRNQVLSHFVRTTYYSSAEHYLTLGFSEEQFKQEKLLKALIQESLRDLEAGKLIRKCVTEGSTFWVLEKPFADYEQSVTLSGLTVNLIAETINGYRTMVGLQDSFCDKSNISEKDIQNLAIIVGTLLKDNNE